MKEAFVEYFSRPMKPVSKLFDLLSYVWDKMCVNFMSVFGEALGISVLIVKVVLILCVMLATFVFILSLFK